jgi:cytoskeleton protein RodZ
MTEPLHPPMADVDAASAPANVAGHALRAAREAAGLSIDAVAQHLKLAPRQVRALEDGDYAGLPGRTFERGFARNYARLLGLDADAVVAALPDATSAPGLDRPALGNSGRPMGSFDERPRRSFARIAIPLLLVGLIGLAAIVELQRPGSLRLPGTTPASAPTTTTDPVMPPPLPGTATPLPNPLTTGDAVLPADGAAPVVDAPAGGGGAVAPGATPAPMTPATPATALPQTETPPATSPSQAGAATLVIAYRAPSWTEVRDGNGQRLLVGTMAARTTQTITGTPPFDVVLGNVSQTTVTWRGTTVDTSAWHRENVARLHLE